MPQTDYNIIGIVLSVIGILIGGQVIPVSVSLSIPVGMFGIVSVLLGISHQLD